MTFSKGSAGYRQLKRVADMLRKASPNKWQYFVGDACRASDGEMWTTILCAGRHDSYWQIDPMYREKILAVEYDTELWGIVNDLLLDPRCPDHVE